MTKPSNEAFAVAARTLPSCPQCKESDDGGDGMIDRGACAWCDRMLDRFALALDAFAGVARVDGRAHERAILDAARKKANKEIHRHAKLADELARLLQRYTAIDGELERGE